MEDIEAKVIELFAMIAEDLPAATQALLGGGHEAVTALAEREPVIDALYAEIEMAERNAQMAELHASLTAEIATGQMLVRATMGMTLAARDYERLGAHRQHRPPRRLPRRGPRMNPPA